MQTRPKRAYSLLLFAHHSFEVPLQRAKKSEKASEDQISAEIARVRLVIAAENDFK